MNDLVRPGRLSAAAIGIASFILAGCLAGNAIGGDVVLNGRTFTLPEGFAIELVAGPPLVDRPMVVDFDEQGRLYVAESSGSNDPVAKQLAERPHRVIRMEDTDGDGVFDRRTIFADRMMLPEGAMWLDGSLYVSAPPSIWKLTDTDGDGVADQRVEWYQGKTLGGCANDLHGPYTGPDGWIYWAKGGFQPQTHQRPGKPPLVTRAAHILRCRPDGSGLEPVMTGGMDNPVELVFTPGGERIFCGTFLQQPGGGKRDGLIHAVYGGIYGKVHDVIDDHPHTGPDVMPVLAHLGPAAPSGLAAYESVVFGPGFRDNLFTSCFNLRKVTRSILNPAGATFASIEEDFLSCSDRDFHPTDVVEDADGSLLVIDTGGWYKLCCPTSQLEKPDVLGGIYRIRRSGSPKIDDPRGLKLNWGSTKPEELVGLLDDTRPSVRRRAIATLSKRGLGAVPALARAVREGRTPESRRNAVWSLTQIDRPEAREGSRLALQDPDETVRQAALHSASIRLDADALPRLISLLKSPSAQNRRGAAEAIGRLSARSAVPALLEAIGATEDRTLDHSLTYALIEINDPEATVKGLAANETRTRRAALIALDQANPDALQAEQVAGFLTSPDPRLQETASWIAGRHPRWGDALAGFYRRRLAETSSTMPGPEREGLAHQIARFAGSPAIQDMLASQLSDPSASRQTRLLALRTMALSDLKTAPAAWPRALADILSRDDEELIREAIAAARSMALVKEEAARLAPRLLEIAGKPDRQDALRLEALAILPRGLTWESPGSFAFLRSQLDPDRPVMTRIMSADILAATRLGPDQLFSLLECVEKAGPMELNHLLPAFEATSDDRIGLGLVAALRRSTSFASLRPELLRPLLARFGPEIHRRADEMYLSLNPDATAQKARLEQTLGSLIPGDVRRGQLVFNGPKAACSSCHAIGYVGGKVGPDLSRVGQIRSERDILEAVLYPSASFVRSYEPVAIATRQGRIINGVVSKQSGTEVALATGADEVIRIPRDEIEEIRPGTISVMPSGLDQQLTIQQLSDLLAFLKACR